MKIEITHMRFVTLAQAILRDRDKMLACFLFCLLP